MVTYGIWFQLCLILMLLTLKFSHSLGQLSSVRSLLGQYLVSHSITRITPLVLAGSPMFRQLVLCLVKAQFRLLVLLISKTRLLYAIPQRFFLIRLLVPCSGSSFPVLFVRPDLLVLGRLLQMVLRL